MTVIPVIAARDLPDWIRLGGRRRPCTIRGLGSDLELTRGLLAAEEEEGGGNSNGGVRWLARRAGGRTFRVFVSSPSRGGDNRAPPGGGGDGPAATFTLDGTDHPDSVLTATSSADMTLDEMIDRGRDWRCRYLVEDDLPPPHTPLGSLVPPAPPSPAAEAFEGCGATFSQRQLFVSMGPCRTQLHRDCFDNLYVCALGARIWTVSPPDDGLAREPGGVSASVPPPPEDRGEGPGSGSDGAGSAVRFARTTLCAGDAVFVPALWWHAVRGGPGASAAANWYYRPPPDPDRPSRPPSEEEEEEGGVAVGGGKRRRVEPPR